ncbi:MAG TPA: AMP-dependent synthetase/ligase [Lacipirellulaceae bacterium]|nr:AMP-dependent synthetase/ligase [Lacipirellulaceae bacterium]
MPRLQHASASAIMVGMSDNASDTIPAFFTATVRARGDEPALGYIREGQLHWRTWREVAQEASSLAARIQAVGVRPGDCVAHVSENRYEWIIADLAMHLAGAVHVPIHVTLAAEQIAEQIIDCGARLVFVSNAELLAKFAKSIRPDLPTLIHDEWPKTAITKNSKPAPSSQPPAPDDLATILYTSGTTGRPRGVMLSQRNLATNAAAATKAYGAGGEQTRLCILPLSHIYARTCDLYTWVVDGARLVLGESRDTLARDCQLVQPTALNAVPFLYQRIAEKIAASGAADPSAALRHFFGGRMERLTSGGAPLAPSVEKWYADEGLPVLQGYGLTEASPVISFSTFESNRFGAVGQPLPGLEVRIAHDGEVLCRGPNVMLGYWHDEPATAEAIRDGWLHTGDLGELDADNFLYIRGRKKELIVLSTGKKVLPTRVENLLTASPLIEQAAVFGDGQCGLVALIVPAACDEAGSEERETRSERIATEIDRCLQSAAHEEQVHHFVLLDRPFSIERGEMTPKLSLCRKTIETNFAAELEEILPRRH